MKKIALFMVLGIITLASCNAKEAGNKTAQNEINKKENNSNSKTESKMKTIHLTKAEFLTKVANYEANPQEWKYLGDRPAIIDFYADWCGPCIQLQKVIIDDPVFEQFAHDKLVLFKADFPRLKKNQLPKEQQAINDQLAETYNPEGEFPCMVLIDAQGNTLRKWHGYDKKHTVQDYMADINAFINK